MTLRAREVSIKQLPEKLDRKRSRLLLREMVGAMNGRRPYIVLDCSQLQEMDGYAMHMLLCCLEEAIKRNGDVRLAAVTPPAMLSLELANIDRLFRIFTTVEEAEESFQRRVRHVYSHTAGAVSDGRQTSANAA
jgi:anti-sigma B factor antagonist